MSEAEIQHAILKAFGSDSRVRIWRSNVGRARMPSGRMVEFGFKGLADICGIIAPYGRALYIEVKSATGKQSEDQRRFQAICERFGAVYVLARSVADVETALKGALP